MASNAENLSIRWRHHVVANQQLFANLCWFFLLLCHVSCLLGSYRCVKWPLKYFIILGVLYPYVSLQYVRSLKEFLWHVMCSDGETFHNIWYTILGIHYDDVIMTTIASQITSLTVVYSIVYSDADERKHQSSASLAFVWGIHRDRWIPRTKGQLRGKCFHLMTSSCKNQKRPSSDVPHKSCIHNNKHCHIFS